MTQLKEMIVEADEKRFPDNELLQQLVSAVTEAERCANVATQLVSKKHRTRYVIFLNRVIRFVHSKFSKV